VKGTSIIFGVQQHRSPNFALSPQERGTLDIVELQQHLSSYVFKSDFERVSLCAVVYVVY
jgi:hypothetical protein